MNPPHDYKVRSVHFVGIGGIGVSALVRMMLLEGKEVSGSDVAPSDITRELEKDGARFFAQHNAQYVSMADMVIYSVAVSEDNPEIMEARKRGIPTLSYPEALGMISKEKHTIAVAGAHGKTTTTAMIADVMLEAQLDPTVVVGSILKDRGSNFIAGKSNYFVVEACEYRRSFLHLSPNVLVITTIDADHLDYYKNLEDIQSAFRELAERVPADGFIVCDKKDPLVAPVLEHASARIIDYTGVDASCFRLKIPGAHNVGNAQAAFAVSRVLNIPELVACKALNEFSGTWRRFEYKGKTSRGALVYDDYAHHPTEVKATLKAAREKFPEKRIVAVFQPHLYSRTKILLDEFAKSFSDADEVIFAPIYAAREPKDESVTAEKLAAAMRQYHENVEALPNFESITSRLRAAGNDTVIFTIGAGDIFKVGEQILSDGTSAE